MITSKNSLLDIFERILDFPVEDATKEIQSAIYNKPEEERSVDIARIAKAPARSDTGHYPHQLFPAHYAVILKNYASKTENEGDWVTVINKNHKPIKITATKLDDLWQDPDKAVGVRFDENTKYLMIDIDIRSLCHPKVNKSEWDRLLMVLNSIGLRNPIIMRSSSSGGYHIYFWFGEEIGTYKLAELMWSVCHANNLLVKDGNIEIFPNPKAWNSLYKGHRLPLQENSGSVLVDINDNDLVDRYDIEDQWNVFCQRVDSSDQDIELLKNKISWGHKYYAKHSGRKGASLDMSAQGWLIDLIKRMDLGWTTTGQTNELIRTVCVWHWVFESHGTRSDTDVLNKILNMPGYTEYCGHQDNIEKRVKEWMDCVERYYWPYSRQDMRHGRPILAIDAINHPDQEPVKTQKIKSTKLQDDVLCRLRQVVQALKNQDLPTRIGEIVQLIQAKAKELGLKTFGKSTLGNRRYAPEWRILVDIARNQSQQAIAQSSSEPNTQEETPSNPVSEINCLKLKPMKVVLLMNIAINNILLGIINRLELLPNYDLNSLTSSIETSDCISFANMVQPSEMLSSAISETNQFEVALHNDLISSQLVGTLVNMTEEEEFLSRDFVSLPKTCHQDSAIDSLEAEDYELRDSSVLSVAEDEDLEDEDWPHIGGYLRRLKARYGGRDIPELVAKVVGLVGSSWQLICEEGRQWNCPIDMVGDTWVIYYPSTSLNNSSG